MCLPRFLISLSLLPLIGSADELDYQLEFSTYLGGSKWEHARDVVTDSQDNIILVGGAAGSDFPVTNGAFDTQYNDGVTKGPYASTHSGCDVFVAKFAPDGTLLWNTFLGGPNYDRAYAVEVDSRDNIIVSGRAGPDFPTTSGAFQPAYAGIFSGSKGFYGYQNAFVAKFDPDGQLLWASYAGTGELCRGVDVDYQDNIFVTVSTDPSRNLTAPPWMASTPVHDLRTPARALGDIGVMKIRSDGAQALWLTWLGGNRNDQPNANIRVDRFGYPYVTIVTESTDLPSSAGAYAASHHGGTTDMYVAKLSLDGAEILRGTYLGGDGGDHFETHPTEVDRQGNVFILFGTDSSDLEITPGAYNSGRRGNNDWGVAKLAPDFTLAAQARIGGSAGEAPDGIGIDARGNVLITGATNSDDYPVSTNAYQSALAGDNDAAMVVFDPDLTEIRYGTYLGGSLYDLFRGSYIDPEGNLYGAGATVSNDFPTLNAVQSSYGGSNDPRWGNGDAILVKFTNPDRFGPGDSDHDSLPDTWEQTHFGTLAQSGEDDPDRDGNHNRLESLQGTDPNDPDSKLRIWLDDAQSLRFQPTSPDIDYTLRGSPDLTSNWNQWTRLDLTPTSDTTTGHFTLPNTEYPLFLSIEVEPIP